MQQMQPHDAYTLSTPSPSPPKRLEKHPPVAGIVAEYNPFHNGHEWMISQLRRGGVHTVVCVMSGAFVQRAEPALLPTHIRARAALAGGADLVLRLPVSWALSSAEGFAQGAVGLLAALGCVDMLAFGAELANVEQLQLVASTLLQGEFSALLKQQLATGVSFATARAAAADKLVHGAGEVMFEPNNILAIEYIKALQSAVPDALRAAMPSEVRERVIYDLFGQSNDMDKLFMLPVPLALPRIGASHDGEPKDGYASASWLRRLVHQSGMPALQSWVPSTCYSIYEQAAQQGAVLSPSRYEVALLSRLKNMTSADIGRHPGAGEGLQTRLAGAAKQATGLDEMYSLAKTKRFAHSRVRRLALSAFLALPQNPPVLPPFAHVLAANSRGLALLRRMKGLSLLPVSTSLAKLAAINPAAGECAQLESTAEDLHSMWLQTPQGGGGAFSRPAHMQIPKH